jgi:hypothetical protein
MQQISKPRKIKRKIFGKKIKKDSLLIDDTTISFFEDISLYKHKKPKKSPKKQAPRTRRSLKKQNKK